MHTPSPPDPATAVSALHPLGFAPKVTGRSMATRLESLEGRTVAFLDCRFDGTEELLGQMQAWLAEHMPAVATTVVQMRKTFTPDDDALRDVAEGSDAAVVLVGT